MATRATRSAIPGRRSTSRSPAGAGKSSARGTPPQCGRWRASSAGSSLDRQVTQEKRDAMDARLIAVAIPIFFLLIGVEIRATRRLPGGAFRFADSMTSLSCGVGQQVLSLVFGAAEVGGYVLVYEHLRVFTVSPSSIVAWVVLLF